MNWIMQHSYLWNNYTHVRRISYTLTNKFTRMSLKYTHGKSNYTKHRHACGRIEIERKGETGK